MPQQLTKEEATRRAAKRARTIVLTLVAVALVVVCSYFLFTADVRAAHHDLEQTLERYEHVQEGDVLEYGDLTTSARLLALGLDPTNFHAHLAHAFSFELGSVQVGAVENTPTATAHVKLTTLDMASIYQSTHDAFAAYLQTDEGKQLSSANDKTTLYGKLFDTLFAHMEAEEAPLRTVELDVQLTKNTESKKWGLVYSTELLAALNGLDPSQYTGEVDVSE